MRRKLIALIPAAILGCPLAAQAASHEAALKYWRTKEALFHHKLAGEKDYRERLEAKIAEKDAEAKVIEEHEILHRTPGASIVTAEYRVENAEERFAAWLESVKGKGSNVITKRKVTYEANLAKKKEVLAHVEATEQAADVRFEEKEHRYYKRQADKVSSYRRVVYAAHIVKTYVHEARLEEELARVEAIIEELEQE